MLRDIGCGLQTPQGAKVRATKMPELARTTYLRAAVATTAGFVRHEKSPAPSEDGLGLGWLSLTEKLGLHLEMRILRQGRFSLWQAGKQFNALSQHFLLFLAIFYAGLRFHLLQRRSRHQVVPLARPAS